MSNRLARSWRLLLPMLVMLLTGIADAADRAAAADARAAVPGASRPLTSAPEAVTPYMTPLPRMAQARCPGGQLVFLSRACGCNGACCLCSRQMPYLNHCTCRCEATPSPCAQGHSAGNP